MRRAAGFTRWLNNVVGGIRSFRCRQGQLPAADFTGDTLLDVAPVTTTFSDESTGSPTVWHWEKNDGSGWRDFEGTPTVQNPTENFSDGTWSIRLTVSSASGSSQPRIKTNYIQSCGPPIARIAPHISGNVLELDGTQSAGVGLTYVWAADGGGGTFNPNNTNATPTVDYTGQADTPSPFTLTLTITDAAMQTANTTLGLNVLSDAPVYANMPVPQPVLSHAIAVNNRAKVIAASLPGGVTGVAIMTSSPSLGGDPSSGSANPASLSGAYYESNHWGAGAGEIGEFALRVIVDGTPFFSPDPFPSYTIASPVLNVTLAGDGITNTNVVWDTAGSVFDSTGGAAAYRVYVDDVEIYNGANTTDEFDGAAYADGQHVVHVVIVLWTGDTAGADGTFTVTAGVITVP